VEKWQKMLAVQHMQDYIENHLKDVITMSMLAKAAGYSQWHSARIFKEFTGKSPFEYIRAMRLSRAAQYLHDEDVRL
jgi:AraC-like DNA-binding protein